MQAQGSQVFLDPTTISVFAVAVAAISAVVMVARRVGGINHPGVAFLAAIGISFAIAADNNALTSFLGWMVAFLNACLLFCAHVGANETATPRRGGRGRQHGRSKKVWLASYFAEPEA